MSKKYSYITNKRNLFSNEIWAFKVYNISTWRIFTVHAQLYYTYIIPRTTYKLLLKLFSSKPAIAITLCFYNTYNNFYPYVDKLLHAKQNAITVCLCTGMLENLNCLQNIVHDCANLVLLLLIQPAFICYLGEKTHHEFAIIFMHVWLL